MTPYHILVISNLISAKNKKSNAGLNTWFMARRFSHVEFPFKFFDEMGKKLSESYYPDL